MKSSLSLKLAVLIALTIIVSSLITIILINALMVKKFSSYAYQRDVNVAQTIADSLTLAAQEGRFDSTLLSFSAMSARMDPELLRNSPGTSHRGAMMGRMREEGGPVPLVITDENGRIISGSRSFLDGTTGSLPREDLERGIPFYGDNRVLGYVLAGSMLEGTLPANEREYLKALLAGVLLSSLLAAFLASSVGFLILRRILKPLKSLQKGVLQLGRGNYSHRVETAGRGDDEISQLAFSFNDMAASLESAEQWKKQIISDTAHELRTPVSLIMGNLEMMLEGVYKADEKRLQSLHEESSHLAELIKDLQVLASAESDRTSLEREDFDPDALLHLSAEGFQAVARERHITIQTETAAGGFINGDRRKIHQVIKNLLSNAVRYTPDKGRIILRSYRSDNRLVLEVEDSGKGIPEEERVKIFDRFYRLDKSRNRGDGGAGLGLAISKAITERHDGEISVHSGSLGGALFRVELPF